MEEPGGSETVTLSLSVGRREYEKISRLAEKLKTSPERVLAYLADVLSDYGDRLESLASELRVREEARAESVFEEVVFYGVVMWESLLREVLSHLGAVGCYELNDLDFDPLTPYLEVELVALELCELKADVVVVKWSSSDVVAEAYYYLEDEPKPDKPVALRFDWLYEPDEHAVVLRASARSLALLPKIRELDEEASKLGI